MQLPKFTLLLVMPLTTLTVELTKKVPKITIIFVVDQLSSHQFQKIIPYCTGGLRFLYDHGINYAYALQAQGTPTTGPGHAALSTGTYATFHGIIANKWFNEQGKKITCDRNIYTNEHDPSNLMVDTLSDQIMMNASQHYEVYTLSLKSRSAIMMAGRLGKAAWFNKEMHLVSSPFYYQQLPAWAQKFNQDIDIKNIFNYKWNLLYPASHAAYQFVNKKANYWAVLPSLIQRTIKHLPFYQRLGLLPKTPRANQILLEAAYACILNTLQTAPEKNIVIWISLSTLDKAGHTFTPYSFETIDIMYQLDQQLGHFMQSLFDKVSSSEVLCALTADHGICPSLPLLKEDGYIRANRIKTKLFLSTLNKVIKQKFGIEDFIIHYQTPYLYCNSKYLKDLSLEQQHSLVAAVKEFLLTHYSSVIAHVWTYQELSKGIFNKNSPPFFLQQQLYQNRSGQLIVQLRPYIQITPFQLGAHHEAPYNYDMQVPLLICQKDVLPKQCITQKVYVQQLPVSLAAYLNVPCPSASTFELLPI